MKKMLFGLVFILIIILAGCISEDTTTIESDQDSETGSAETENGADSDADSSEEETPSSFEPDPNDCYGFYKNSQGEWLLTAADAEAALGGDSWQDDNFEDWNGCLSFVEAGPGMSDGSLSVTQSFVSIQSLLDEIEYNLEVGTPSYQELGPDHYLIDLGEYGSNEYKVIDNVGDQALLQTPSEDTWGHVNLYISEGGRELAVVCDDGDLLECSEENLIAIGQIVASRMP